MGAHPCASAFAFTLIAKDPTKHGGEQQPHGNARNGRNVWNVRKFTQGGRPDFV
jgi:hypothetical protein